MDLKRWKSRPKRQNQEAQALSIKLFVGERPESTLFLVRMVKKVVEIARASGAERYFKRNDALVLLAAISSRHTATHIH